MPGRFTPWRLACFLSAIAALEIEIGVGLFLQHRALRSKPLEGHTSLPHTP
jgi:hypothetical protein